MIFKNQLVIKICYVKVKREIQQQALLTESCQISVALLKTKHNTVKAVLD